MNVCPKCKAEHSKPGKYCSRKCANSREMSAEEREKRSKALKGKTGTKSQASLDTWKASFKEAKRKKYLATPFNELGMSNRRRRVFEEQEHKCKNCGINEWLGNPITLELEHKDGNHENNARENLEGLCPNCHSITDTWRGRNKPAKNGNTSIDDATLLKCLQESSNIRQGLLKAGIAAKGSNYERAKRLLGVKL